MEYDDADDALWATRWLRTDHGIHRLHGPRMILRATNGLWPIHRVGSALFFGTSRYELPRWTRRSVYRSTFATIC